MCGAAIHSQAAMRLDLRQGGRLGSCCRRIILGNCLVYLMSRDHDMRAVALLALAACCMPRAASGQGPQAAGRMVSFPVRLEVPRFSDISFVQPVDIQFVMQQPNRGKPTPLILSRFVFVR